MEGLLALFRRMVSQILGDGREAKTYRGRKRDTQMKDRVEKVVWC